MNILVLHVTEVMAGGVATYINELVREQIKMYGADRVKILCPQSDFGNIDFALRERIEVYTFVRRRRGVVATVRLLLKLIGIQRKFSFDIIHAHSSFAGAVSRLPGVCGRARIVYTPNSWSFSMNVKPLVARAYVCMEKWLARGTYAIAAVSKNELALALNNGIRVPVSEVIPTGIGEVEETSPEPESALPDRESDAVRIIMVARFAAQKRQDDLVEALATIRDLDWFCTFVGDGERRDSIERKVHMLNLSHKMEFLGNRRDVPKLLAKSDIFVMTSLYEGLPLSILEAMRASLPVIANDVDGNGEAVVNAETGYLVQRGDVSDLSDKLRLLIQSKELRERFGQAGRKRFAETFTATRMSCQMHQLYVDLLGKQ